MTILRRCLKCNTTIQGNYMEKSKAHHHCCDHYWDPPEEEFCEHSGIKLDKRPVSEFENILIRIEEIITKLEEIMEKKL